MAEKKTKYVVKGRILQLLLGRQVG